MVSRACWVIVLAVLGLASIAQGETFECAFLQEKYDSGKANVATCSMLPEKVFSTEAYTPRRNQHCRVDAVSLFQDLTDVIVDTDRQTVAWTRHIGFTADAKPRQKAYLVKEQGLSEQEAERKVQVELKEKELYRIVSYQKAITRLYVDEVTQKLLNPAKKVPAHNFFLANAFQSNPGQLVEVLSRSV